MSLLGRLAGAVLGPQVPPSELPEGVPPDVTVRRCGWIPALGGILGKMQGPAAAVTLRRTILVHPSVRPDAGLMVHELVHVEQWRADPLFPLKYAAESARRGYRGNRYEVEAYARERAFRAATTQRIPGEP